MQHQTLSVMFTDMHDYAEKTSRMSRQDIDRMISRHREILTPVVVQHGGKVVKEMGDAFLVTFDSPTNSVLAGLAIQQAIAKHNGGEYDSKHRLALRVAICTGEVMFKNQDVLGEAVNVASRLQQIANVDEVYFTESTYLLMNKAEVPTVDIGYRQFKGIPQQIKVYRVLREGESAAEIGKEPPIEHPVRERGAQEPMAPAPSKKGWALLLPGFDDGCALVGHLAGRLVRMVVGGIGSERVA